MISKREMETHLVLCVLGEIIQTRYAELEFASL